MTQKEKVKQLIANSNYALCDNCIADILKFPKRQMANQYARELNAQGLIKRSEYKEQCGRCKSDKLVNKRI